MGFCRITPPEKIFTLRGSLEERLNLALARIRELEKEDGRRRSAPFPQIPGGNSWHNRDRQPPGPVLEHV